MHRPPRLPTRAWVARVILVVLLVWIVTSGILLVLARQRASSGLSALQQARNQLTAEGLLQGKGLHALQDAKSDFSAAHDLARNPVLAPWDLVPIIGHNVGAVRGLTGAADQLTQLGSTAARDGAATLRQHPATGEQRLTLLQQLAAINARAHRGIEGLDLGPDSQLLGPIANARTRLLDRLDRLRTATTGAAAFTAGAARLLTGPRQYLVLAANNGEMRAGSGMFLEAGTATFANGSFTIGPMVPTPGIPLPAGAVPLSGSLAALWSWVSPSQEWRNLATTPRFDETAPLAAQMWQAVTGQHVDGVLAIDPIALRALLAAQGPIDAANEHLTRANIVPYLLLGQYGGTLGADPTGRREQLGPVARASVDALASRPWQGAALVSELAPVGKGRHVLAWARDPLEEKAWRAAGIDGGLKRDSLAVSVLNFGGNKLDQFLTVDATLSIRGRSDGGNDAHLDLELQNSAPAQLPGEVGGPNANGLTAGEYQGVVAVNVPGAASLPSVRGIKPLVGGVDGLTKMVAGGYFQLPRGQRLDAAVDFHLPAGVHDVQVEPSSRYPPITWHYGHDRFLDAARTRLAW